MSGVEVESESDKLLNKKELSRYDQQIEEDIRSIRRSSFWFASIGVIALLLLTTLVIITVIQRSMIIDSVPPYKDIGFVKSGDAILYDAPGKYNKRLGVFGENEAVFVLRKTGEWYEVQRHDRRGWMKKDDLITKQERRQRRLELEEGSIRIWEVGWTVDEVDNYTIVGKIENLTTVPIRRVKVIVEFLDKDSEIVNTRTVTLSRDTSFHRGKPLNFSLTGKNERNFSSINYRVEVVD